MKTKQMLSASLAATVALTMSAALASFSPTTAHAASAYTYRPVARTGQIAPGGSQYISYFEVGKINNFGDVIYGGEVPSAPFSVLPFFQCLQP